MTITYDLKTDAMYIRLLEGDFECRTLRLTEDVALDLGPNEQLVGIEILDASEILKLKDPATIQVKNLRAEAV